MVHKFQVDIIIPLKSGQIEFQAVCLFVLLLVKCIGSRVKFAQLIVIYQFLCDLKSSIFCSV